MTEHTSPVFAAFLQNPQWSWTKLHCSPLYLIDVYYYELLTMNTGCWITGSSLHKLKDYEGHTQCHLWITTKIQLAKRLEERMFKYSTKLTSLLL